MKMFWILNTETNKSEPAIINAHFNYYDVFFQFYPYWRVKYNPLAFYPATEKIKEKKPGLIGLWVKLKGPFLWRGFSQFVSLLRIVTFIVCCNLYLCQCPFCLHTPPTPLPNLCTVPCLKQWYFIFALIQFHWKERKNKNRRVITSYLTRPGSGCFW